MGFLPNGAPRYATRRRGMPQYCGLEHSGVLNQSVIERRDSDFPHLARLDFAI
jgi:hypothetical protein